MRYRDANIPFFALVVAGFLCAGASQAAADTVTATWDRNPESNIAGYILSYGTQAGTYPNSIDVGNVTTKQLTLNSGQKYYFVVQAYNSASQVSPRSAEVSIDLTVVVPSLPSLTSLSPTSGTVGTAVTINGANFGSTQGSSTVRFNGTVATATSWSASRIVTSVPAGATSGSVTVTVNGVSSNSVAFTVPGTTSTITLLQHRSIDAVMTSGSLPFTASNIAGNFIAVVIRVYGLNPTLTVADSRGNTYRRAVQFNGGSDHTGAIYYAENIAAGSNTVTVSATAPITLRFSVLEYAGVATSNALEGTVAAQGSSGSANSGTLTTMTSGALLLGAFTSKEDVTFTAGAGYAIREGVPTMTYARLMAEDRVQASAGAASASATLSTSYVWGAGLAAFKTAGSAPSPPPPSPTNVAPTLTQPASQTSTENTIISLALVASDPEGAPLTYSAIGLPPSLSVAPSTGIISGTLSSTSSGTYTVTATVSDGALTNQKTFTWLVRNPAVAGDIDGDGMVDVGVYRPSSREWRILRSTSSYATSLVKVWGDTGAIPVSGDFDGDSISDLTYYMPSTGVWSILKSSSNYTTTQTVTLGASTDIPVAGDYDGDSKTDVAVYQPSTGRWQILKSTTNFATNFVTVWGAAGDLAVPGDYDGDRKMDLAVYRPSAGQWRILRSSTDYSTNFTVSSGIAGDIPVPADYDGDGRHDVAVYRPSNGMWYILTSSSNYLTSTTMNFGDRNDTPIAGDFDGDGKADFAIFNSGSWQVRWSSQKYGRVRISWGTSGDIPLPKRP